MRDRFVGDIGDFGKYGLLRALCGGDLRLGVLWYFVGDRMTRYLEQPGKFRECDARLFEALRELVGNCQRSVATIEERGILPRDTVFFRKPVPTQAEERREWAQRASTEMEHCDLVFLDPDNGIGGDPPRNGRLSAQYVYYDDLKPFVRQKRTTVIYHHFGRISRAERDEEVESRAAEMRERLGIAGDVWALVWHPYAPRAYFIIPSDRHRDLLDERITRFLKSPWGQRRSQSEAPHFEQRWRRSDP